MMGEQIIAQGNVWNLYKLGDYDASFKEGETGNIRLFLKSPVSNAVVSGLESALKTAGMTLNGHVTQTTSSPAVIRIPFKRTLPPLAIAAIVIVAIAAICVLLLSWNVSKDVGLPMKYTIPLIILAVIALFVFAWFKMGKPGVPAGLK